MGSLTTGSPRGPASDLVCGGAECTVWPPRVGCELLHLCVNFSACERCSPGTRPTEKVGRGTTLWDGVSAPVLGAGVGGFAGG